jgi:hypothetical protein
MLPVDNTTAHLAEPEARAPSGSTVSVVVPVYNKAGLLRTALDSVVAAARRHGACELILVDNGSTDGSYELLDGYRDVARVERLPGRSIASVRNHGARLARGRVLCFLDCDIEVPLDYFAAIERTLLETGAAAVGRRVGLPRSPHWIEVTWDALHAVDEDGYRNYVNSGNFAVRRDAFELVGGFDGRLTTGEDTDICRRLRDAGFGVYSAGALSVGHLDNPKTLRAHFRREQWHGLGMSQGRPFRTPCKPTIMTATHIALTLLAIAILLMRLDDPLAGRLVFALLLVLVVPAVTVTFRLSQVRRHANVLAGLVLYEVYYAARAVSLFRIVFGLLPKQKTAEPDVATAAASQT